MPEPRRLAFCITDLDVGGAERALVQLVARLNRTHWAPAVYCLSGPGALVDALEREAVPVVCLGARGLRDIGIIRRLSRELRQFRPELLQTFLFHANLVGRIAAWRAGVPRVVCGIRVAERRANLHLRLDRWTQRLVDRYVCVSRGVADFSVSIGRLPPHKIEVIGNGVDVSAFDQARPADLAPFGIPPSGRVVVTVARLDAQKGLVDLVEAASLLAGSIPDLHFLIVGEGAQRSELETLIAHCGLSGRVHLAGHRSDIPQILRAAFAFVLPSRWEGMPNAVLEAMATGLPVIATHVEGTDELVQPGITGLLVSPQSPPQIASALAELTAEPDRAATMGRAGRERAQSEFLWESVVENYERLYRSLLDSPC